MRKTVVVFVFFAYAEITKVQISCAVAAYLISAFDFA